MIKNGKYLSGVIFKDLTLEKERTEIVNLLDSAFKTEIHGVNLKEAVWHPSIFKSEHTKIATINGKVVGVIVLGERKVSFPPVEISAATIGPIATHPDYQRRGISSGLMDYALNYVKNSNKKIAYLQGIPNFYSKYGFFPYIAKSKIRVNIDDVALTEKGQAVDFESPHLPELKRIYKRATGEVIFSPNRDDKIWSWLVGPAQKSYYFYQPKVIQGNDGKVHGYFSGDPEDPLNFREVIVDNSIESCNLSMSLLKKHVMDLGASEFEIKLPYRSFLMTYLKQHLRGTFLAFVQSDGGSLFKIFDSLELFQDLVPYLNTGLEGLGLRDGSFCIKTMSKNISFKVVDGVIELGDDVMPNSISIPEKFLPALLTGYFAYEDLAPFCEATLDLESKTLLKNIFPQRFPFLFQGDAY